jgi:5-oxoprolinase (ATP-hydrolysing)
VRRLIGRLEDGAFTAMRNRQWRRCLGAVTVDRERRTANGRLRRHQRPAPRQFQTAPYSICRRGDALRLPHACSTIDPLERRLHAADPPEGAEGLDAQSALSRGRSVAGNVETSQVITDCLFAALRRALAPSQGTMNNFTFGNATYQYYETIAGGAGAGPDFDGASAVHTHMTNSRLTDPEILETRLPVILERFAIRRGSGGAGAHRGGDGIIRHIRFLEPMTAGILANRRRVAPRGIAGGG